MNQHTESLMVQTVYTARAFLYTIPHVHVSCMQAVATLIATIVLVRLAILYGIQQLRVRVSGRCERCNTTEQYKDQTLLIVPLPPASAVMQPLNAKLLPIRSDSGYHLHQQSGQLSNPCVYRS